MACVWERRGWMEGRSCVWVKREKERWAGAREASETGASNLLSPLGEGGGGGASIPRPGVLLKVHVMADRGLGVCVRPAGRRGAAGRGLSRRLGARRGHPFVVAREREGDKRPRTSRACQAGGADRLFTGAPRTVLPVAVSWRRGGVARAPHALSLVAGGKTVARARATRGPAGSPTPLPPGLGAGADMGAPLWGGVGRQTPRSVPCGACRANPPFFLARVREGFARPLLDLVSTRAPALFSCGAPAATPPPYFLSLSSFIPRTPHLPARSAPAHCRSQRPHTPRSCVHRIHAPTENKRASSGTRPRPRPRPGRRSGTARSRGDLASQGPGIEGASPSRRGGKPASPRPGRSGRQAGRRSRGGGRGGGSGWAGPSRDLSLSLSLCRLLSLTRQGGAVSLWPCRCGKARAN